MKIVSIGTDRTLFVPGSAVSKRMIEQAAVLGELHIIVFARYSLGFETKQIDANVWVYPTNSASRWFYLFDAYRIAKGILKEVYFGKTVITCQDPFETAVTGLLLERQFKIPLQIQVHTDAWSPYFQYGSFLNWFRVTFLAPLALRRASGVRVVSQKIARDVITHSKLPWKRVSVLPVFVDIVTFANAPVMSDMRATKYPNRSPLILMASRVSKEKNIRLALKVFKRICVRYEKAALVIVGDGPELKSLKRFVSWHSLSNNVFFESWQKDIGSYMKTADAFLSTSNYEGYGMSIVEAGAVGCPVVTTRVGVGQDMLEDGRNALLCEPGDENCLFSKLTIIAENVHLRRSLGEELQKNILATALTKEVYLNELLRIFDNLFETQ